MRRIIAVFAATAFVALSLPAVAAEMTATAPIVLKDKMSMKATVVAIDHQSRTVDLKGPQGNVVTLDVDEAVKRFDAMKVGDMVTAEYFEAVSFEVQKPGTPKAPDMMVRGGGKITGEKPAGAIGDKTVTTVTITAIDKAAPAVTYRTSDGAIKSMHVRHPEYLDRVKVGDQVQVTRTAALIVSVAAAN